MPTARRCSYVFHYPYVTTPCFLIDLGAPAEAGAELETSDGRPYRWTGGVGPGRSIVAFSAICAHRMSYPTRNVSFIDYRHKPMNTEAAGDDWWSRGQVIYCCSEGSVYDPSDGARVLAGPAPQPLAAVRSSTPTTIRPCLRPVSTAATCSSGSLTNLVSRFPWRTSGMISGARHGM
jgi:Rieske Fe-S protein